MLAYLYVTLQVLAEVVCYYYDLCTNVEYVVFSSLPIVFICGGTWCIVKNVNIWGKTCEKNDESEFLTKKGESEQLSSREKEAPTEMLPKVTVQKKKRKKKNFAKKDPLPVKDKEDPASIPLPPSDSEDEALQLSRKLEKERRVIPKVDIPEPFCYTFPNEYVGEFAESSLPFYRELFTTMKTKAFADVEWKECQDSKLGLKITCLLKPEQQNAREMCKIWKQEAKRCLNMIVEQIREKDMQVDLKIWEKAEKIGLPPSSGDECMVHHNKTKDCHVIHLVGLAKKVQEHSLILSKFFKKISDEIKQAMIEEEKYEMKALIVHGLNDDISKDYLKLLLERHSQCDVREILYGMRADTALVNFSTRPDFIKLMGYFEENTACGIKLHLKRIPKIDTIQVHPKVTKDLLELYFESKKKSGGSEVLSVNQRNNAYIVKFKDPKVIANVLSRSHKLEGKSLHVDIYYEDLDVIPPYHDKQSPGFDIPDPFMFAFSSPKIAEFVMGALPFQKEICKIMTGQKHASVDWVDKQDSQKGLKITCLLKPEHKNAREMCEEWIQKAKSCLDDLLRTHIDEKNLKVTPEVWRSATEHLKTVSMPSIEECIVKSNKTTRSCVIHIVGLKQCVQKYHNDLSIIFKKVSDELEWRSQCVQEVYDKIKPVHVRLMEKLCLFGEIVNERKHFAINWDKKTGRIQFSGHKDDIMTAKLALQEAIIFFEEETLRLDPHIIDLLKQGPCYDYVCVRFSQVNPIAIWGIGEGNKVFIVAKNRDELSKAKKIFQTEVICTTVPVPKKSQPLFDKPEWLSNKHQIETECGGLLRIIVDSKKQLILAGTDKSVAKGEQWFEGFLIQSTVDEEYLPMTTIQSKFIKKFMQNEIKKIQRQYSVKIIQDTHLHSPGFQITGVEEARKSTLDKLKELCHKVKSEDFNINNKPGVGNLFLFEKGIEKLKTLEDKHKVIINAEGGQQSTRFSFHPFEENSERGASPVFYFKGSNEASPVSSSGITQTQRNVKVDTNSLKTKAGLTVRMKIGDLVTEKVDVIVNSTSSDLNLSNGTVSKYLLKAGGQEIQSEAYHKVPVGGLKSGDIVSTSGGKLKCKSLYHCCAATWDAHNGSAIKGLGAVVRKALKKMDSLGYTSIAFPAIGTGGVLGYPHQIVAETMLQEVMDYSPSQPQSMKEVRFILYSKDQKSIQAFQKVFQSMSDGKHGLDPMVSMRIEEEEGFPRGKPDKDLIGVASGTTGYFPPKSSSSPNILDFMQTYSGTTVEVLAGDITEENTDAIVNSSSYNLDLHGEVSTAIITKGGSSIRHECRSKGTTTDDILITRAGTLKCSRIIHLNAPGDEKTWSRVIMKVLKAAERNNFKSIAFPVLGTGNQNKDPRIMAGVLMKTIKEFCTSRSSIKIIRVVVFQRHMVQEFSEHLRNDCSGEDLFVTEAPVHSVQHKDVPTKREPVQRSRARQPTEVNPMQMHLNKECKSEVKFLIYKQEKADISEVKKQLREFAEKECERKKLDDDYYQSHISDLEKVEMSKIENLEKQHPVKITIQKQSTDSCILLEGVNTDILSVTEKIMKIFRDVDMAAKIKDLTKTIQWKYEDGDVWESYPPDLNFNIEEAFKKEQRSTKWKEEEGDFVVTFHDMKEENIKTGIKRDVKRDDLTKDPIDLPPNWTKMEAKDGLKQVTLDASNVEYKTVAKKFTTDVPHATIKSIKRIQNPELYKQYMLKKNMMQNSLPNKTVMRELWHGTAENTIEDINKNGFDRNYAGKNATAFGKGVYFACYASYSANDGYSVPDMNGDKHIYLALVLTGEYTQGTKGLLAPPIKNSSVSNARYDSVVDNMSQPSMFVVFHDTQVYPQYLIKFQ